MAAPTTAEASGSVRRVVCIGIDGSPAAEHAFEYYFEHIHQRDNYVVVVHSFELPLLHSFQEMYVSPEAWEATLRREAEVTKEMRENIEARLKEHGASGKFVAKGGKPGEMVCKVADEEGAVMIVVGTRGYGKLRRTIMGSVSSYILHHAHCPVTVCRKPGRKHADSGGSDSSADHDSSRRRHESGGKKQ